MLRKDAEVDQPMTCPEESNWAQVWLGMKYKPERLTL